jgi:hypothetical protein
LALSQGASDKCTIKCTGDQSSVCGGTAANMIYSFAPPSRNLSVNYYLGCFTDWQFNGRTLPTFLGRNISMTRQTCAQAAAAADLAYFGMSDGNQCWGGSNLAMAQSQGVSDKCTAKCAGDQSSLCGGTAANMLYSFDKGTAPTPVCGEDSCYLPLGCYVEPFCSGGTRGMSQWLVPAARTVPACAAMAKSRSYLYFSVQNGNECYGSNSTAYAMSKGLSTSCTVPCTDDVSAPCGGSCANAIYQVGPPPAQSIPARLLPQVLLLKSVASLALGFHQAKKVRGWLGWLATKDPSPLPPPAPCRLTILCGGCSRRLQPRPPLSPVRPPCHA